MKTALLSIPTLFTSGIVNRQIVHAREFITDMLVFNSKLETSLFYKFSNQPLLNRMERHGADGSSKDSTIDQFIWNNDWEDVDVPSYALHKAEWYSSEGGCACAVEQFEEAAILTTQVDVEYV